MVTIKEYKLARNQTTQVLQIPKFFQVIGIIEKMGQPWLHVVSDDTQPLVDVDVWTFDVDQDLTNYLPFIRKDMYVGTYLKPNNMDAQMVFL